VGETAELLALIALATRGDTTSARERGAALLDQPGLESAFHAKILAALAFAEYIDARFAEALVLSERAVTLARASANDEAHIHALAMRMFASAGLPWAGEEPEADHFAVAWAMRAELARLDVESRMIASHFLAEGALATGRLSEAMGVLDDLGDIRAARRVEDEAREPYLPFFQLQRVRILLFRGELAEALPLAQRATREALETGNAHCAALGAALGGLIEANLDDRAAARRTADETARTVPQPAGLLETGTWIVSAYALFAVGDRRRAAEFVRVAGASTDLRTLQVVDRALGFDILVTDALDRGDLAAASQWGEQSIAVASHPAASAVIEQLLARLDAARGDTYSATERATVAAARARLHGRYLDAARADLIRARALAASGLHEGAVAQLTGVAHDAERVGVPGLQRSAIRELRLLGRRLAPSRGSGWSTLTERERQIAVLAAEGFSNRVIAQTLYLSDRTVQAYVSRVLTAFGISSRTALPRHVADLRLGSPRDDLPRLTPRQWEVARLIADGRSNQDIATHLEISIKTAEKHVGEIMARWDVSSRTSIANLVVAESTRIVR
jgi:DNA-binding NarL/FixJ family response regulator